MRCSTPAITQLNGHNQLRVNDADASYVALLYCRTQQPTHPLRTPNTTPLSPNQQKVHCLRLLLFLHSLLPEQRTPLATSLNPKHSHTYGRVLTMSQLIALFTLYTSKAKPIKRFLSPTSKRIQSIRHTSPSLTAVY